MTRDVAQFVPPDRVAERARKTGADVDARRGLVDVGAASNNDLWVIGRMIDVMGTRRSEEQDRANDGDDDHSSSSLSEKRQRFPSDQLHRGSSLIYSIGVAFDLGAIGDFF
jgi:hypothetical protein